jgi:hypothetical protein
MVQTRGVVSLLSATCCAVLCRVGRTARAGRAGWSLSFITQYDVDLVAAIEGHIGAAAAVGLWGGGGWGM